MKLVYIASPTRGMYKRIPKQRKDTAGPPWRKGPSPSPRICCTRNFWRTAILQSETLASGSD